MKNTLLAIILLITTLCLVNCENSAIIPDKNENKEKSVNQTNTVKVDPSIDDWPEPDEFDGVAKEV